MKINGKEYLNPQQQLVENTKDIEELKNIIKPEYKTTATLTSSSTSVAIASTNAPEGTTEGWLITEDGLKFKITGGDETNLLLVFYADLKGPQGEDGAAVSIDDSGTANNKTWSSQKINNSLDKGIFTTMVEPTDLGGGADFRLDYEDAPILIDGIHVRENDLILYIDGDSKVKYIYSVYHVYEEYVYLRKQGEFGGKKLYQHNIYLGDTSVAKHIELQIINDVATEYSSVADVMAYLYDNGFAYSDVLTTKSPVYKVNGNWFDSSNHSNSIYAISVVNTTQIRISYHSGYSSGWLYDNKLSDAVTYTSWIVYDDTVIELQ